MSVTEGRYNNQQPTKELPSTVYVHSLLVYKEKWSEGIKTIAAVFIYQQCIFSQFCGLMISFPFWSYLCLCHINTMGGRTQVKHYLYMGNASDNALSINTAWLFEFLTNPTSYTLQLR